LAGEPALREIPIYQVDAFTDAPFSGNPAAVCLPGAWPDATLMQSIAAENNLSETAFLVPEGAGYGLRWFTPKLEVPLCGHATLAAGFVLLEHLKAADDKVAFETQSGTLTVQRSGDRFVLDFPTIAVEPCDPPAGLAAALGAESAETFCSTADYVAVFERGADIVTLTPDFGALKALDRPGVIVTARGEDCDFVSRYFAPAKGVDEDPVTGRAHCLLAPFWAARLGRNPLAARQLSARGGSVGCEIAGDRVRLSGRAVLFFEGTIRL